MYRYGKQVPRRRRNRSGPFGENREASRKCRIEGTRFGAGPKEEENHDRTRIRPRRRHIRARRAGERRRDGASAIKHATVAYFPLYDPALRCVRCIFVADCARVRRVPQGDPRIPKDSALESCPTSLGWI